MQFQSNLNHEDTTRVSTSMYLPGMGRVEHTSNLKPSKQPWSIRRKKTATPDLKAQIIQIEKPTTLAVKDSIVDQQIFYQAGISGGRRSFTPPEDTGRTNAAAKHIQQAARGLIARTKFRVRLLEHKLATMEERTAANIAEIQLETDKKKLKLRQKATKKQAKLCKKHLAYSETTKEGNMLIHCLRAENKKLRKKNDKIAQSIHELNTHNGRLEGASAVTRDNHALLDGHYKTIKQTNVELQAVVPKYEARIAQMKEALEIRRQYAASEHKMKVLYINLTCTLAEMVEHHSGDKKLAEELVSYCLEAEDETGKLGTNQME